MSSDRIRLSVVGARRHSELALMGLGYDAEEAAIIADHTIDAALCRYEYSGLAKLLNILEHRGFKLPRRKMSILLARDPGFAPVRRRQQCRHLSCPPPC